MWDTRWRRWDHSRAVGVGWLVLPQQPRVTWRAKIAFSRAVRGYAYRRATWLFTRSQLRRLGPPRPRTSLQRATTHLMGRARSGRLHCGSVFRTEYPDKDKVGWTYNVDGGSRLHYGTWLGRLADHHWRSGRLLGWTMGPRATVRVDTRGDRLRIQTRRGRASPWLARVSFSQFEANCPLD